MTIRSLSSASFVYVGMRATDDFFNLSPIGNCVRVLVRGIDIGGRITNAATGEPVPGIMVSASLRKDTTGADGTYFLENVPSYTTSMNAVDENAAGQLGDFFDYSFDLAAVTQYIDKSFCMIPAFTLENEAAPSVYYGGRFLKFFKEITETDGLVNHGTVYKGWNHWPITVYNPPMTYQDIDLQEACRNGMRDWEDSTGLDLFVEVGSLEGADASIQYDTTLTTYKHHVETAEVNADGTPARKILWIYTKNSLVPIRRYADVIFTHELGHVIGLYHSRDPGHLMLGLTMPVVEHPTLDEARVVQVLYHMPNIFDYSDISEQ
ncbi:MAG: M57 family metalloprotease [Candidatus Krumholzibacteria bacterium]|nr:M57 family metalloprotease [Candidatus Krumholzibacteria bacterium]